MKYSKITALSVMLIATMVAQAGEWTTYFAYNNVTQIAMSPDKVFAISDGNLFSVNKMTEEVEIYNRQSGLHATGITCIHYDELGEQLIICYATGKIDILSSNGVQYIGGLYDKDMTQRKTIYNVTISGRTAYLATHYGIQTMDLRECKMVDSYWLRPGGLETVVKDVLLTADSIYAFTDDSLFCAAKTDNLVDYTYWKREIRTGRISPDTDKGVHYEDAHDQWYRGLSEGIVRYTATERLTYKPDGPIVNTPYRMTAVGSELWVVPGGRWASQYKRPGHVMHYDGVYWHYIHSDSIEAKTLSPVLDMVNVAVDPANKAHFFTTSYGTGVYEFDHDTLVSHSIGDGSCAITAIVPSQASIYTRLDCAEYDSIGNLWLLDANLSDQLVVRKPDGVWHSLTVKEGANSMALNTPAALIIDHYRKGHKWIGKARATTGVCLIRENGTPFDTSDDETMTRVQWTDQLGRIFLPGFIYEMIQDSLGRVWIATDIGVAYIDSQTDFFVSDAISRPEVIDENGENPLTSLKINALCEGKDGEIWIGTDNLGVYVLNSSANTLLAHYTTENSAMPSNTILSLTRGAEGAIWIGTGEGLVRYEPSDEGEGITGLTDKEERNLDEGDMLRWKLHFSYCNAQEVEASEGFVYALANGSLFSVDKADGTTKRWSKANGLNGSTIVHIAFDPRSGKLVVGYHDGRVDLINDNGRVEQMPDIYMKTGSVASTINSIYVGSKHVYLAMPFGIVALDSKKAEVSETYYIGDEAGSVDVQQIVEIGDSLYAFSYDRLYSAFLKDNLADYQFWKNIGIPFEMVTEAEVYQDRMYVLYHDSLYRREAKQWRLVTERAIPWIHVSGNKMLCYEYRIGLWQMEPDEYFGLITDRYYALDAVYTNGQYWLGEAENGLVHLAYYGAEFYRPEGPINNFSYKVQVAHDQVYMAPGGRWAAEYGRWSGISILGKDGWRNIPYLDLIAPVEHDVSDIVGYAVDPRDPGHFYVASYGGGVIEFKDYRAVRHYGEANSTLRRVNPDINPDYYTRVDGAMMDEEGNLWICNATTVGKPLHVLTPTGQWHELRLRSNGSDVTLTTPGTIQTDRRDSRYKWITDQRSTPGLIFLFDNGTPTISGDDRSIKRHQFVDQNGNVLSPSYIYCIEQDRKNRMWVGTEKGVLLIPAETDFFTSNACRRIIVPRNDGTGLGDYLLGEEQIKCMAIDGGNRMWIGTASSGVYVIEDDTITAAHFTENNSLLPSNSIQSIAINPTTGEVFVGTDKGLASYRADANEAQEKMTNVYAYPNPVRPDYSGYISITGLMENTTVNIVDAGGNLVCKTKSHGGTAVWDGKLPDGRRATAGVYTALCNANGGSAVVKILIIR